MGKKSPDAPDMSAYAAASERAAELGYKTSQEQLAWAREMWGEQQALLEKVLGPQLDIMKQQYENGMKDRARYEQLYQPLEENLVAEFQSFDTPERRAQRAGQAQAQVRMAQEAQRNNALSRLESFGIDPSQTRSAALDRGVRAQEAAQVAAAGNVERQNVENTGRALRAEAINIGRGYPSQVAGSYGQTLQAGNSAMGNMNSTVGVGANTMGTGLQWGAQGLAGTGQAANITSQGYQNKLAGWQAQGSPWELVGQIGGAWAGSGFQFGKQRGGAIAESLDEELAMGDIGPAGPDDVVPAQLASGEAIRLAPGEFILPREAVEFYGTDKLRKMVAKAREAQGIPEEGGAGPKINAPKNSREVRA